LEGRTYVPLERVTLHRRAIRELRQVRWVDRDLLPFTKPIAAAMAKLQATVARFEDAQRALPKRAPHRPAELAVLLAAISKVIHDGESPARVLDYTFQSILQEIPGIDMSQITRAKILERLRHMPNRKK
jgi:hypothetical protein